MIFLKIRNLSKKYQGNYSLFRKNNLDKHALINFSLDLYKNEIFALVGESGSGKTTLGQCVLQLMRPNEGQIIYQDIDLLQMKERQFRQYRPKFQMIFQHPEQALNPRQTVGSCLVEPLQIHSQLSGDSLWDQVIKLLDKVGLNEQLIPRFPYELSGGQQQRVVIARALSTNPSFLIADEPTSSLDAVHKRKIIALIKNLQQQLGLTMLLISHDLRAVSHIADRIGVMYRGELIEYGSKERILKNPVKPYTKLLLESIKINP